MVGIESAQLRIPRTWKCMLTSLVQIPFVLGIGRFSFRIFGVSRPQVRTGGQEIPSDTHTLFPHPCKMPDIFDTPRKNRNYRLCKGFGELVSWD